MTVRNCALMLALGLLGTVAAQAQDTAGAREEVTPPLEAGPPPISLSLPDAIQMGLKNNLDIKIAQYTPKLREQDILEIGRAHV